MYLLPNQSDLTGTFLQLTAASYMLTHYHGQTMTLFTFSSCWYSFTPALPLSEYFFFHFFHKNVRKAAKA